MDIQHLKRDRYNSRVFYCGFISNELLVYDSGQHIRSIFVSFPSEFFSFVRALGFKKPQGVCSIFLDLEGKKYSISLVSDEQTKELKTGNFASLPPWLKKALSD